MVVIGTDETVLVDICSCKVTIGECDIKELKLVSVVELDVLVDVDITKSLGSCIVGNLVEGSLNLGLIRGTNVSSRESSVGIKYEVELGASYYIVLDVEVNLCEDTIAVEILINGVLTEAGGSCSYNYEAGGSTTDSCCINGEDSVVVCILSIACEVAGYIGKNVCIVVDTDSNVCKINVSSLIEDSKLNSTAVYELSAGVDSVVDSEGELKAAKCRNSLDESLIHAVNLNIIAVSILVEVLAACAHINAVTILKYSRSYDNYHLRIVTGSSNDLTALGLEAVIANLYPVTVDLARRLNKVILPEVTAIGIIDLAPYAKLAVLGLIGTDVLEGLVTVGVIDSRNNYGISINLNVLAVNKLEYKIAACANVVLYITVNSTGRILSLYLYIVVAKSCTIDIVVLLTTSLTVVVSVTLGSAGSVNDRIGLKCNVTGNSLEVLKSNLVAVNVSELAANRALIVCCYAAISASKIYEYVVMSSGKNEGISNDLIANEVLTTVRAVIALDVTLSGTSCRYSIKMLLVSMSDLINGLCSAGLLAAAIAVPYCSPARLAAGRLNSRNINNKILVDDVTVSIVVRTGSFGYNVVTNVTYGAVVLNELVGVAVALTINSSLVAITGLSAGGAIGMNVVNVVGILTSPSRLAVVAVVLGIERIELLALLGVGSTALLTSKDDHAVLLARRSYNLNKGGLAKLGPYVLNHLNRLGSNFLTDCTSINVGAGSCASRISVHRIAPLVCYNELLLNRLQTAKLVSTVGNLDTNLAAKSGSGNSNLNVVVVRILLSAEVLLLVVIAVLTANLSVCNRTASSLMANLYELVTGSSLLLRIGCITVAAFVLAITVIVVNTISGAGGIYRSIALNPNMIKRLVLYDTLGTVDLSELTALGTAVNIVAVLGASGLELNGRNVVLEIVIVTKSRSSNKLFYGNNVTVLVKVSIACRTNRVCLHGRILAISLRSGNLNQGLMSGLLDVNYARLGLTAILTSLVSLVALLDAGRSLCRNVYSELVALVGSSAKELVKVVGVSIDIVAAANLTYSITPTVGTAGRSLNVFALKNPLVSIEETIGILIGINGNSLGVAAVLTGESSLASLGACGRSGEIRITILALVIKCLGHGLAANGTGVGCVSILIAANVAVAVLVGVDNALREGVARCGDNNYLLVVTNGTRSNLFTVGGTGSLGDYSLTPGVLPCLSDCLTGVKNRSSTLGTLIKLVTALSAGRLQLISENEMSSRIAICVLNVDVCALSIDRILTLSLINSARGRVLVMVMGSFCENGNNAAYAHNNGKQKSKNSFRIVLH